jgi:CubicO group peptidase (beta-lactamase class C family)
MTARIPSPIRLSVLGVALVLAAAAAGWRGVDEARAAPPRTASQAVKQLERIVRDRVDSGRSTGIVAGMVLADGSTRVVAYGDGGHGRRLTKDSVFEIGSITKTFTATLLSQMARSGEVQLGDPVASLLPAQVSVPSRHGRRITLENLATQTSGLPRLPDNMHPADNANPYADYGVDQLYAFLDGYKLPRDPGAAYEYSNLGVGLLGYALSLRAHRSYEDLVRDRILAPLGMASTAITITPALAPRFVDGHDEFGRIAKHWDIPTLAGAVALRSSMTDMLAYAAANLDADDGPLQQAMAAARAPRLTVDANTRIGLIWNTQRYKGRDIVWHDGGTGGFFSFIGLDEARHTAIVVLSNSVREPVEDIGFHALDSRLALEPARKAIPLAARVLRRYVGTYDGGVTITRSGHHLVVDIPGLGSAPLYAQTRTRFFFRVFHAQMVFDLDRHGRVTKVLLRQSHQAVSLRKVG